MNLKPFNLEEALNGAKVVTRDGREVKQLTLFESISLFPLVGVFDNGMMSLWSKNGKHNADTVVTDGDLFIVVETKSVWANVCANDNGFPYIGHYKNIYYWGSEEDAKKDSSKMPNYIKTIEITNQP